MSEVKLLEGDIVRYKGQLYFIWKKVGEYGALIMLIDTVDIFGESAKRATNSAEMVPITELTKTDIDTIVYE